MLGGDFYSPTITVLVVRTSCCWTTGTGWLCCPDDVNRLEGIFHQARRKKRERYQECGSPRMFARISRRNQTQSRQTGRELERSREEKGREKKSKIKIRREKKPM